MAHRMDTSQSRNKWVPGHLSDDSKATRCILATSLYCMLLITIIRVRVANYPEPQVAKVSAVWGTRALSSQ